MTDSLTRFFALSSWASRTWLVALVAMFALSAAQADDAGPEKPRDLVAKVTDDIMTVVRDMDGGAKDTEGYNNKIQEILDPVVDFTFIARAVMGNHGSDASREQQQRFAEVFKAGLVSTYARGIASYADSNIRLLDAKAEGDNQRRVSVDQEVRSGNEVHRLSYTMALNNSGQWKVINVVLNGVNLGQSFRSQFTQAMRRHSNDLDKVIDNWLADS